MLSCVIPAKAGIQRTIDRAGALCLDSRLRGNDKKARRFGCGGAALGSIYRRLSWRRRHGEGLHDGTCRRYSTVMMDNASDKQKMDDELRALVRDDGMVGCASALAYAREKNVAASEVGARLTALDIKIVDCQLGCFGQHRENRRKK